MSDYRLEDVKPITVIAEAFGDEVELEGDQGGEAYRLLAEFSLTGREYAVLQNESQRKDDEVSLYRIVRAAEGEPELETIEDDDEWERVAELYDEMTVSFDDEY